ncbi:MAG: site-2 protease family protein [bacterium]|nr:site-2 protease family protein [bacterium]
MLGSLFDRIADILLLAPGILWALTIHEFAHGWVAYKLGDPTAKMAGRLSLNPIRHLDPIGTLMLFIARIGWAKPVPINPRHFRDPRWGIFWTSCAGPGANFINGAIIAVILTLFIRLFGGGLYSYAIWPWYIELIYAVIFNAMFISFALGFFNLIPVPPLDGSNILWALLPEGPRQRFGLWISKAGRYIGIGILVIFALQWVLGIPIFGIIFNIIIMPPVAFLVKVFTFYDLNHLWAVYSTIAGMG